MNKQQEEWKERFRHYFIEMHPINGHDMHNRPLLYDAEFEKIELLVEFIQHEIQLARKEAKIEMLTDVEQSFQNGREEALEEIKSTEKDVAAEKENQKLPSELIKELSQQDFGGRIGIGTIMRAMDHLAKKNNWKI